MFEGKASLRAKAFSSLEGRFDVMRADIKSKGVITSGKSPNKIFVSSGDNNNVSGARG